jgi:hypothetical protein
MKKVRIHISKLGPIIEQEIELAQLMLFTGDSNLGKSYTNFLCYYLFNLSVSDRLNDYLLSKMQEYTDTVNQYSFTIKTDDLRLWMENDVKHFFIYLLSYPEIECNIHFYFDEAPETIQISVIEHAIEPALEEVDSKLLPVQLTVNEKPVDIRLSKAFKKEDLLGWIKYRIVQELTGNVVLNSLMMPPGRASLLSGSFTTQKGISKMGLYEIFLVDNDKVNFRALRSTSLKEDQQFFISRIRKLLGGDLVFGINGLEFKLETGQTIPIEAAASSIKELAPILMWIKGSTTMQYDSVCIEEPEAHCHPIMQSQLSDLLVACINKGCFMQITTHSDYLLKRLNQLIRLHDLKKNNLDRYNEFCDKFEHTRSLTLDREKLRAYYFRYSKEENRVKIELQDLSNGIPFDSFSYIIDREMEFDEFIEGDDANL